MNIKLLIILFLSIILKSCGNTNAVTSIQENTIQSLSGNYIITMLSGKNATNHKLTISFDGKKNQVSGFSGCNRFSGSYINEGNNISLSSMAVTRMACMGNANTIETHFLKLLQDTNKVTLENEELTLYNNENVLLTANQDNSYHIEYKAQSRGFFLQITVSDNIVSIQKDWNSKPIKHTCSKSDWEKLMTLLEDINIKSLSKLEAPTKAHQYDGAAIANLKITYQGKDYQTQSFDHGTPPKEIEAIVSEILSISQKIE
ncbi:MAG: META domain-containing protein [Flavobacteriaceae bacterium]